MTANIASVVSILVVDPYQDLADSSSERHRKSRSFPYLLNFLGGESRGTYDSLVATLHQFNPYSARAEQNNSKVTSSKALCRKIRNARRLADYMREDSVDVGLDGVLKLLDCVGETLIHLIHVSEVIG